jgi:prepilin-type N-terminal cleavage/methylation domain-containing protein
LVEPELATTARRSGTADGGFSLIELIISVVLMGIVVAPVLSGVQTAVMSSSRSRVSAEVETVLQNAAALVGRAPDACSYDSAADQAALSNGWGADRLTTSVQNLVTSTSPTVAPSWGPCSSLDGVLVQLVAITVTDPSGKVGRTLKVVKSDV